MTVILDAGALIGIDRRSTEVGDLLASALRRGEAFAVPSAVVAQVWRDGARQAVLARWLGLAAELPLDDAASRRIGQLLKSAGTSDVVDGAVVDAARNGDVVFSSDVGDISALLDAAKKRVRVIRV